MPLVSVIVPTHNRPEMLAEALASVRAQTFTDFEIIVVSNGESVEMQRRSRCAAQAKSATYVVLNEGNVSAARNFGIAKASGQWIAFLDDDDTWPEDTLATLASGFADLVFGNAKTFPDNQIRRHLPPKGWSWHRAFANSKCGPYVGAVLIKRQVFNQVLFDPRLTHSEDSDFWRRVSWAHSIAHIDKVVLNYRQGHASASMNRIAAERGYLRHYWKMLGDTPERLRGEIPAPWTIACRWLLRNFTPRWLRHPRKQFRSLPIPGSLRRWASFIVAWTPRRQT